MPSAKTVRRNREQWQPIVEAWHSSGPSASEYCPPQHLSYAAFCNWRRHFSNIKTTTQHHTHGDFLDLSTLPEPIASGWHITLKLGGDIELVLSRQ